MHEKNFTRTLILILVLVFATSLSAQYHVNGSAVGSSRNCFTLTPDLVDHNGSVWYGEKVDLNNPFDLFTRINLGCNDGSGADGIAFVLQPISTNIGSVGGGIGYMNISPSFAVEFDTYQNTIHADPTYDHVAIQKNGDTNHEGVNNLAGPVQILPLTNNMEDCQFHEIRTSWDPRTLTFRVYVNCVLRLTYVGDIVSEIFGGDSMVFWGFTAATGGLTNQHEVCFDFISFTDEPEDREICAGESVTLVAGSGDFIGWSPAIGLSNPNVPNPIASPATTTTYTASFLLECGDIRTSDVTVFVNGAEAPVLGEDITVCSGEAVELHANQAGNPSILWNTGETTNTITVDQPGMYTVEVSGGRCGVLSDTIFVGWEEPLSFALGPDQTICEGESLILDATDARASGYSWNTGENSASIEITEAGSYRVEVSHAYCPSVIDTFVLTTIAPIANLPERNYNICGDGDILLDAFDPNAESYIWNTGANNSQLTVSESGTYVATLSNAYCPAVDRRFVVSISDSLSLDLGPDTILCDGETLLLDAFYPNAESYLWQDGDTNPTKEVQSAGTYYVDLQVAACPPASDTIIIEMRTPPSVDLGKDTTLCVGQSLVVDATSLDADSYTWNDGIDQPSRTLSEAGLYIVNLSNSYCPSVSDSILIEVAEPISLDLGPDTILCNGETLLLDAFYPNAESYLWQDGDTNPTKEVQSAGTYYVDLQVAACLSASDTIIIEMQTRPAVDLGEDTTLCVGQSLVVDATSLDADTYAWNDGNDQPSRTLSEAGLYIVNLSNPYCPSVSDSILIEVDASISLDLGPDTTLCKGQSIAWDVESPYAQSYLWENGDNRPIRQVEVAGNYSIAIESTCGTLRDSIRITVEEVPQLELGADTVLCVGASLLLDVLDPYATTYAWSDGDQKPMKLVETSGMYTVSIGNAYCPFVSDSIQISFTDPLEIELGDDRLICQGEEVLIDAFHPQAKSYQWSSGENTASVRPTKNGLYTVKLEDGICPTVLDSIRIRVSDPQADFMISPDPSAKEILEGEPISIESRSQGAATYAWSIPQLGYTDNRESFDFRFPRKGEYEIQLIVEDAYGLCQDTISRQLQIEGIGLYIPTAFTPNGNGTNENWRVVSLGITRLEIQIYNRWGRLVYESSEIDQKWDGKNLENRDVPEGVYVFKVSGTFPSGVDFQRAGTVTLIR